MLQDENLKSEFIEKIEKNEFSAEYAVSLALRVYVKKFQNIDDPYLSARVGDIFDIEKRLLRNLLGEKREELKNLTEEVNGENACTKISCATFATINKLIPEPNPHF